MKLHLKGSTRLRASASHIEITPYGGEIPKQDVSQEELPPSTKTQTSLREGAQALRGLLEIWMHNFDLQGDQPDRKKALSETMAMDGYNVLSYIQNCGGLTNSIMQLVSPSSGESEKDYLKKCRHLACNMAQVSSILMPPLAAELEPNANFAERRFF